MCEKVRERKGECAAAHAREGREILTGKADGLAGRSRKTIDRVSVTETPLTKTVDFLAFFTFTFKAKFCLGRRRKTERERKEFLSR